MSRAGGPLKVTKVTHSCVFLGPFWRIFGTFGGANCEPVRVCAKKRSVFRTMSAKRRVCRDNRVPSDIRLRNSHVDFTTARSL